MINRLPTQPEPVKPAASDVASASVNLPVSTRLPLVIALICALSFPHPLGVADLGSGHALLHPALAKLRLGEVLPCRQDAVGSYLIEGELRSADDLDIRVDEDTV
jgi:hypothetical protein